MFDLVLHNGLVLTQAQPRTADAVAISSGRIAAVGRSADLLAAAGRRARRIDLAGRTVVPGFNDAHAHVWKIGHLRTTLIDLRGVRSLDELTATVRRASTRLADGAWVLGRGYNEAALQERRSPTRHDLDAAAPGRPVVLTRTCGHICVASSAALARAAVTAATAAPGGGVIERDEAGEPTGVLHETATGLVTRAAPKPTATEYEVMIRAALEHQLRLGITSSSDCGVTPPLLDVYRAMESAGTLPSRVNVMPLRRVDGMAEPVPLPERFESPMLRVDTVKLLADGGLSGATAALKVSYRHRSGTGVLRFEREEMEALCRGAHEAGWRIATHAIGDAAIDQVLDVYERLDEDVASRRHRIEHFGLPDAAQIRRARRLGVVVAPQTIFLHELGRNFREYLPDSLLLRCYPVRSMIDGGLPVALSSDAPVVEDDNPLAGIAAAVTRRDREGHAIAPAEAIAVGEALYAYTMGGAIASGDEDNRGSIEAGKWADLAVLSGNPLETDPEALTDIHVDMTLLAGNVVNER